MPSILRLIKNSRSSLEVCISKRLFYICCRHIISVFLGVAETIVGSFVCCGVGTILNKATNNFLLSALCTEVGQRSSLLISPSRDIAKQQRNNRL